MSQSDFPINDEFERDMERFVARYFSNDETVQEAVESEYTERCTSAAWNRAHQTTDQAWNPPPAHPTPLEALDPPDEPIREDEEWWQWWE